MDAREDIDFFFSGKGKRTFKQGEALNRALYIHMTLGSKPGKHIVVCPKCWDYYQQMKREHCGG